MWLIDRTWKPREGWSRPALTVEDNQHHHDTSQDDPGDIIMAARTPTSLNTRVHDPVPNPPPERRITEFCGGHGPGETPGPIPNPEAKPWHGDGTMPERTWESSTPPQPHFTEGPGNTRSPGLRISQATHHTGKRRRSPARADNPHRPHRHTGGTYHTARFPSHLRAFSAGAAPIARV